MRDDESDLTMERKARAGKKNCFHVYTKTRETNHQGEERGKGCSSSGVNCDGGRAHGGAVRDEFPRLARE